MQIEGKVIARMEVRGGTSAKSGKEWKSIDFVVEHGNGQYPEHAVITFGPDPEKVNEAMTKLRKDTEAVFSLDIDAREFNGKWYNTVKCWKFEVKTGQVPTNGQPASPEPAKPAQFVQAPTTEVPTPNGGGDELPF